MKALVLAGGRGSRLNMFSDDRNKCMHLYRGRPLIEYSLENAIACGAEELIVVVSYRAESIINWLGNRYHDVPVRYVIQWERKGLVHAMECSREAIGDEDFQLFLADEIFFAPRHRRMLEQYREHDCFAICGVVWVEDMEQICNTYALFYNEQDQRIYRLVEKPRRPLNHIMGTGNCIFSNKIFDYIPYTPINQQRSEKELPDLIQCAIDDGKLVKMFDIADHYVNINRVDDLERLEQTWSEHALRPA